jgi:phosphomevalonate kinase
MEVIASAPGKLVLLGEYAVLEGAAALVLAVNRRAKVRMASRTDGICNVSAPDLDVVAAPASIDSDGVLHWLGNSIVSSKLRLVEHVWNSLRFEGLVPSSSHGFDLHLDTSGFFHADKTRRAKLGLGSSAALTVALAGTLVSFTGHGETTVDRTSWLHRLLAMHRDWQGGRGSGVDVAASVAGGLIAYQLAGQPSVPSMTSLEWPMDGLHCLCVWSGHSVSTADFLQCLSQWRITHAAEYAMHMRDLGVISTQAIEALRQRSASTFVELVAAYATALYRFGNACGLEIFSPAQQHFAKIAARVGVSYKPCGAGGDFGVVFTDDLERLAQIARSVQDEGMQTMPLALDPDGFAYTMQLT